MRALERERDCVCPSNVKRERGVLCSVGCVDIRREGQKVVAKKQRAGVRMGEREREGEREGDALLCGIKWGWRLKE